MKNILTRISTKKNFIHTFYLCNQQNGYSLLEIRNKKIFIKNVIVK
jgi:hypothetical protein